MPKPQDLTFIAVGGKNLEYAVDGDLTYLRFDHTKNQGASQSQKTDIFSTSSGNKPLMNGLTVGFNAYKNK
jgi:hypothetical protein